MRQHVEPAAWSWPPERAGALVRALASAAGFPCRAPLETDGGDPTSPLPADAIAGAAADAGLRCESVSVPPRDAWAAIRTAAPVVLSHQRPRQQVGLIAVLRADRGAAVLLTPAGRRRVSREAIEDVLWAPVEANGAAALVSTRLPAGSAKRSVAAARILAGATLSGRPLAEAWSLRPPSAGMRDDLRAAHLGRRVALVVAAYLVQVSLLVAIWNDVGTRTLAGAPGTGWAAFAGLLVAWVAAQLGASWLVSRLALDVGAVVRGALMRGALRLERDRIRALGLGQLLGRAMDAEVLDALALGGLVEAVAAAFELALGACVLTLGVMPRGSLATMALALCALGVASRVQKRRLFAWSARRRALTHDLVERMVGHRTALVQDRPSERRQADATALGAYERDTRALDRVETVLAVGIPRGWLLAGLAVLAPLLMGAPSSFAPSGPASIALTMGGVWLVYGALRRLGAALPTLALARDAWAELGPLAGGKGPAPDEMAVAGARDPEGSPAAPAGARAVPLIAASGVGYQYQGRPGPALTDVHVRIAAGERVLVQGASGGGKSTLAALLTGLRVPTTGQLSLRGIPQQRVGLERWRRAIAGAPQFHDNHVFSADLLFNVLMGRRWPPRLEDVQDAERVCRELGLGALLDRMPAGMQQQVGETGWRLSHGERSRIFVARSLLQRLEGRVLDESFAALDPQTLDQVLEAVLARPEALIVIAHP